VGLPEKDSLVGHTIGGSYRVTRVLGSGGMGTVYEASHVRIPKQFAIKVLNGERVTSEEALKRFWREAQIAGSLGSKHIVDVIDFSTLENGAPYMVMELLRGEDLSARIKRRGRLPLREALAICEQIVAALSLAHTRGIIHRDLKPENVFLCTEEDGTELVKILDFGISKVRGEERTLTGDRLLGTPAYMSPEQARSDSAQIDERTDIYALGAVVYEMLTGHMAFDANGVYATLTKILEEMPAPMSSLVPELPTALDAVVRRALAKEASDRYARARELMQALERAAEGGADIPAQPAALTRAVEIESQEKPIRITEAQPERDRRSRRLWIVAGAVALVVGAGGLVAHEVSEPEPNVIVPPLPVAPQHVEARPALPTEPAQPKAETSLAHVRLHLTPPDAEVFLDGQRQTQPLVVPAETAPITLTVRAPGHRSRVVTVVPSRDLELTISLDRVPSQRAHSKPIGASRPPSLIEGNDL
jgi:serine/threonine-protein kinase